MVVPRFTGKGFKRCRMQIPSNFIFRSVWNRDRLVREDAVL